MRRFRLPRGWLRAAAGLWLLTGWLLPQPALAATTWQAKAGAQSADLALQVEAFLPNALTVDVGDTITWTVPTAEPHTITFLSGGTAPSPFAPGNNRTTYDGTGLVNTGLIAGGAQFSLTFTATGTFPFVCLLHPLMTGTVTVQTAGTAYPFTQGQYDAQAAATTTTQLANGATFQQTGLNQATQAGPTANTAGIGDTTVDVMRFLPGTNTISVGQTVTWTNRDPDTPHTITFGTPPSNNQVPAGTDSAGHATIASVGQAVNSGFVGTPFPQGATFSVTFTAPGTYNYVCILHSAEGMTGSVVVVAASPTPVVPELPPFWLFGSGLLALGLVGGLARRRRV